MRKLTASERRRYDWLELHVHALTEECPDCEAAVDEPCRNLRTGEPLAGPPAHIARIRRADRRRAAELDDPKGHT